MTVKMFSPSEKGSTLKEKNFAPFGSKFFPFRVEPFSEWVGVHGKNRKSQKLSSMHKRANQRSVSDP